VTVVVVVVLVATVPAQGWLLRLALRTQLLLVVAGRVLHHNIQPGEILGIIQFFQLLLLLVVVMDHLQTVAPVTALLAALVVLVGAAHKEVARQGGLGIRLV